MPSEAAAPRALRGGCAACPERRLRRFLLLSHRRGSVRGSSMDRYATAPRPGRARARFVRVVPGETAARTMIMWIPQLISCGIHMKSEIPLEPSRPACGRRGQPAHSPHGHHAPLKSAASARQGPKYPALRVGAALGVPGRCARLGSRPEVSHAVRVPAHIVSRTAHVRARTRQPHRPTSGCTRPAQTVSRPRVRHACQPPTSGTRCQPAPRPGRSACVPAPCGGKQDATGVSRSRSG